MSEKTHVKVDKKIHKEVKKFVSKTKGEIGFFFEQAAKEKLEKELLKESVKV